MIDYFKDVNNSGNMDDMDSLGLSLGNAPSYIPNYNAGYNKNTNMNRNNPVSNSPGQSFSQDFWGTSNTHLFGRDLSKNEGINTGVQAASGLVNSNIRDNPQPLVQNALGSASNMQQNNMPQNKSLPIYENGRGNYSNAAPNTPGQSNQQTSVINPVDNYSIYDDDQIV